MRMVRILEAVVVLQRDGGLSVTTGSGDAAKAIVLYPVLSFVCCDNKEAAALASIKAGQTTRPCRHCMCELSTVNSFHDAHGNAMREAEDVIQAINNEDKAFSAQRSIHNDVKVSHSYVSCPGGWRPLQHAHRYALERMP